MTTLVHGQSTPPPPSELVAWGDRKLDNEIRKGHSVAGAHMRNYEQAATVTGVLLRERKRRLAHGEWTPWLQDNFDGSHQTATAYIRMADESVPQTESPLSVSEVATSNGHGEIVDAEPVPDEPQVRPRRSSPDEEHAAYYLPDLVREDADLHLRTQAVHWFAQGERLQELLSNQTPLTVRSDEDRTAMENEAANMARLATHLKDVIRNADID